MPGREKKMLKDLKTGTVYESLYAAGKDIGPREYAEGSPKNPAGKIKQDQHVWFAIHRDKDNVGRFQVSTDQGKTFVDYPFTPSKRKSAAERKAKAEAKATAAGGAASVAPQAGETKEQRIARLQAELAAETSGASNGQTAAGAVATEAEEPLPARGTGTKALAGNMKVAKTA